MKILGIDTSSKYLGVAVIEGDNLLSEYTVDTHLQHASLLIPYIDRILKDLNLSLEQIDGISISLGPGSFTGLRIGLATVKGLALASHKPVVGVPTLDVIAYNLAGSLDQICVILNAKKNQVYWAVYKPVKKNGCVTLKNKSGYNLSPVETLLKEIRSRTFFTGDGIDIFGKHLLRHKKNMVLFAPLKYWYPRAGIVAQLGETRLKAGQFDQSDVLQPMYLYAQDCTIRK